MELPGTYFLIIGAMFLFQLIILFGAARTFAISKDVKEIKEQLKTALAELSELKSSANRIAEIDTKLSKHHDIMVDGIQKLK